MPTFREGEIQSRRCTDCGIQYPPQAKRCPICGNENLWNIYKTGPDEDWEDRVRASLGEGSYASPDIAYTTPHRADVSIPLHVFDARLWLPHAALIGAGYLNLEAGSVVYVNNRFYELWGRSKRQGDMWWVEEIVTDGAFDNVTPEDIING